MKKALAYALSLALLLSLTACNKPQADQPDTSQPDLAATTDQVDATNPEPEQPTVAQLSHTEQPQEEILQGDELIAVFQEVYNTGKEQAGASDDERLELELAIMPIEADRMGGGKQLPADYAEQYIEWRSVKESPATSEGTSSNQATTPTETVRAPSDSGSPAQATQAQGGETPASGENPSGEVDLDAQHTEHDPSTFTDFGNVNPNEINSYDPESGLGSAGHFGIGVHVG